MISHNINENYVSGIFGAVDDIRPSGASGWLIDTTRIKTSHKVNAFLNEKLIGSTETSILRKDISSIVKQDAYCGFHIQWDQEKLAKAINESEAETNLDLRFEMDGDARAITVLHAPSSSEIRKWITVNKIFGNLDCIDEHFIAHGWAIDLRVPGKAKVELYVDGRQASACSAKLARPDLAVLKPSQIMSGFKISIPSDLITNLCFNVDAQVSGHPLPGSPLKIDLSQTITITTPLIIKGCLTAQLIGWPGEKISGELHINGVCESNISFEKRAPFNRPSDPALLSWKIPSYLSDGQPKVYSIIIKDSGKIVRSDVAQLSHPSYKLHVDDASFDSIRGWAFSEGNDKPLKLSLWRDSKLIDSTESNIDRPDVQEAHSNSHEECGFIFKLNSQEVANQATYTIKDNDTGISIASIYITAPYESLVRVANELSRNATNENLAIIKTLLSKALTQQKEATTFSTSMLPQCIQKHDKESIDIIIPIYGGAAETIECIESVLSARNTKKARFVLINDCTPDPLIDNYLNILSSRNISNLLIIHRKVNGGFSEAVNIGFNVAGSRDVILLNADTVVQNYWIDRICAAAEIDSRIGTITPLSNNAEICTVPYICKSLNISDIDFAELIDRKASLVNSREIIDIPVAIGFCMYIRRECLIDIGFFDAAKWGRGYGEEVDFCLKATAQGWRHTMLGDTFVVHRGNVSFGDEKLERVKESARKISEIYPFYDGLIQRFLTIDPGRKIRRKLNLSLICDLLPTNRILHLSHSFGGGTEQYLQDMAQLNKQEHTVPILLKFNADGSAALIFDMSEHDQNGFFIKEHQENYRPDEINSLIRDIEAIDIHKVHIHSPYGTPAHLLEWLTEQYSYALTVHDYAWICPQVTLCPGGRKFCGEATTQQCNSCIKLHEPHEGLKQFLTNDHDICSYRNNFTTMFSNAEVVLAGANDVKDRMLRFNMNGKYKVISHAAPESSLYHKLDPLPPASISGAVKVALIGGISDIKGYFTLLDCAREAASLNLPIEFIVFGHTMDDQKLKEFKNIKILGKYQDEDLYSLISSNRPHISFFPSNCPETFSYTLSHSLRIGLWPVVSNLGATAERVQNSKYGTVYDRSLSTIDLLHLLIDEGLKIRDMGNILPEQKYTTYPNSYREYIEQAQ